MIDPIQPMRDAHDYQKPVVAEANLIRGVIISCYAQVEFLLADICMKAWRQPEYRNIKRKFPYKLEDRIRSALALLNARGPLHKYSAEAESLFHKLKNYEQYRHFLAHGLCVVEITKAETLIIFHLWRPALKGAELGHMKVSIEQFHENADEIARYCSQVVRLFYRMYMEQDLEIPPEAFGPPRAV